MEEKDRWSVVLEYLKLAVTLATGLLAVAAAIYSDATKVPTDNSRFVLLGCVAFVLLTLIGSVLGVIKLSNHYRMWRKPEGADADATAAANEKRSRAVTVNAGLSFFGLVAAGIALSAFFAWRTLALDASSPTQVLTVADGLVASRIDPKKETATIRGFETRPDRFYVTYAITPGTKTITFIFLAKNGSLETIDVKP
jgi:hypothetical protein